MGTNQAISRRKFLHMSLGVMGSAAVITTTPRLLNTLAQNPESAPWLVTAENEVIIPTVCLLCPSGCGMLARIADGNLVKMEGSPMHPINLGALCPKGQAAPELLYNPDRIEGPLKRVGDRGAGQWEPITWHEAITTVAGKLSDLREDGHPERAVMLYGETRGQKRSFLERFMAAVGSPNAVSHDSLNIEAAKLGTLFTQGIYDLPAYDLENCNYVLGFGASFLEAGRSPQRMVSGFSYLRRGRAKLSIPARE
jgi:thiosulfate reductase/polysulfide reductase chain A